MNPLCETMPQILYEPPRVPQRLRTLFFIAACALVSSAQAQNHSQNAADCTAPWDMSAQQLQGEWTATVGGQTDAARLQLGPHPEWKGTVKGTVERDGTHHAMVGDVNNGAVTLEESANGINISGTWLGEVSDDSCAREIRGDYQAGDDAAPQPFVLRKRSP